MTQKNDKPYVEIPRGGGSHSSVGPAGPTSPTPHNDGLKRVRKKRKNRKVLKVLGIVVAVIVVLVAGVGIAGALWLNSVSGSMSMDESEKQELSNVLSESSAEEPYYALLLGSDAREGDTASRSDTMILARIDANKGRVTLVSIPRDTKVEIEGHGTQKINAAYAFGGASGAVEAVSEMAGVPISHYVEIHFEELEKVVDDLGGIWVDVPESNNQTGASNTGVSIRAGEQLMDGETALAFARERYGYLEGDFQRAENQRLVVQGIVNKIMALPPTDLPGTIQSLASSVSTDYELDDLITLAQQFQKAYPYISIYSCMTPSTTKTINGVSYTITLEDEWKDMMELVDAGQDPSAAEVKTENTQATGSASTDSSSDYAASKEASAQ